LSKTQELKTPSGSAGGGLCAACARYTGPTPGVRQLRRDDKLVNESVPAVAVVKLEVG